MKKLLVCLSLAAFAVMSSAQAGEQCTKGKTACATEAKSSCCAGKMTAGAKSGCSAAKRLAKKNSEVKGATLLVRR